MRRAFGRAWVLLGLAGCVVLFAGAAAGSGSNLIPNASFESGGSYSFSGWGMTSSTNSAASDAEDGSWAAKIAASGTPSSYGIYVKPQPVAAASAGDQYQGSAWVRSDTPGRTVCVNVKEVGATGQTQKSCLVTQSSWQQLPAVTLTVTTSGDAIGFVVNQPNGVHNGDSFEVDSVSLVQLGGGTTDATPPSTPGDFASPTQTTSSISLSWTASSDPDNDPSTLSYQISRNGSPIATTPAGATSYIDNSLAAGTSYNYSIVAVDPAANQSAPATLTTSTSPDTTPPTAPTNVTATANSTSSITVKWKASTDPDDTSSDLNYDIYRYTSLIATVPSTAPLSFTDSGLQSGTSASYYVVASDPAGNQSATSKTAWATTASAATPVADWEMDEPSGTTTMLDSSPNGNSGALTNVTAGVAGYSGSGYSFTPKAYVSVPDSASLDPGYRNISVTVHLNTSSLPSAGDFDLLRKGKSPGDVEYKIELLQSGQILCALHGLVGGTKFNGIGVQSTGASLADGNWHTITCGRTDYKTVSLTVDGTQYTASLLGAASLGAISPSESLYIGANPVAGNDYYRGSLDAVTVQVG